MRKNPGLVELFLFFVLTAALFLLFLVNLPLFQEPHGFLIMNELSDFSSNQLTIVILSGSVLVCIGLGVLMMKWFQPFSSGMASNLLATTFFLMWVDSVFALSVRSQSFRYLVLLGLALLFFYLFFFTLHYLGFPDEPAQNPEEPGLKFKVVDFWLAAWMVFYLAVSARLLFNSFGYPELQWPLAMGFCALCFLNYLLFLFLRKSRGKDIDGFSRVGRFVFGLWFLSLLCAGFGQHWFR